MVQLHLLILCDGQRIEFGRFLLVDWFADAWYRGGDG